MNVPQKIEISHKTIIFTVFFLGFLWLLFQIRDIILLLFISFVLMSALRPLVDSLEAKRIPRILAILLLYIVLIAGIAIASTTIFPPLVTESIRLGTFLPAYLSSMFSFLNIGTFNIDTVMGQIGPLTQNLFGLVLGIFSNILSLLTILVFAFYFLIERKHLESHISTFFGEDTGTAVMTVIYSIEDRLGAWVRSQLLLMLIIGVSTYVGLLLLGVEFALPLALIAGLLEIVPIIGPIISAVPAIIVALSTATSPVFVVPVIVMYFLIQQLENNVFVPTIMRHAVGLSPIITLIALMVGSRLGGITGAILAVPLVVTIQVIIISFWKAQETAVPTLPLKKSTKG